MYTVKNVYNMCHAVITQTFLLTLTDFSISHYKRQNINHIPTEEVKFLS